MTQDPNNDDRAAWAATAIEAFTSVCPMDGEDMETKAKDLITNLCHLLRSQCGLPIEEVGTIFENAFNNFEAEVMEEEDE